MISGDRGTGKAFTARLIHERGSRRVAPFVRVNGEDEFSDDLVKTARHGTLFIDGVDMLGGATQLQLLRLLDGAMAYDDVRVMSSTTVDLFKRVHTLDFREDLFYRLNVIHLVMRDRAEAWPWFVATSTRHEEELWANQP